MSEEPAAGQNIVPFGKHKGKDVLELIEADPNYIQWLVGQDWFRDKYVTLHQTIINRGPESEETPEHNALQVMFLDDAFCLRFANVLANVNAAKKNLNEDRLHYEAAVSEKIKRAKNDLNYATTHMASHLASEHTAKERLKQEYDTLKSKNEKLKLELGRNPQALDPGGAQDQWRWNQEKQEVINSDHLLDYAARRLASYDQDFADQKQRHQKACDEAKAELEHRVEQRDILSKPVENLVIEFKRVFEDRGVDVMLHVYCASREHPVELLRAILLGPYLIEIKPVVSDDYPAVLRQMNRNASKVLFLKSYTGRGATREQFIATFATAGFRIVFLEQCT